MECLKVFIFLYILFIASCEENGTIEERRNESIGCVSRKLIYQSKYTISIVGSWSNFKHEGRSLDIWKCIKNKSCHFKGKYNGDSQQLCICSDRNTSRLCIGIKCNDKILKTKSKVTQCKYAMENDAQLSSDYKEIEVIQTWYQHLTNADMSSQRGRNSCSDVCSFSVIKNGVHTVRTLGAEKLLTMVIDKFQATAANESTCVFLKCKEKADTNLSKLNMNVNSNWENWKILQASWNYWKKEIVLVSSGVVLLSGIFGFLFGACFSFHRKNKSIKRYTERKCVNSANSELYAQISDTLTIAQGNMQTIPDQIHVHENATRATNPCDPPNCSLESDTGNKNDFDYSHIYNILEANYGPRSISQPSNRSPSEVARMYTRSISQLSNRSPSEVARVYSLQKCVSLPMLPEETLKPRTSSSSMMSI